MRKYSLVFVSFMCIVFNLDAQQYFSTSDMQRIPFTRNASTDKLVDLHYADLNKDGLMDVLVDGSMLMNQSGFISNASKPVFFINNGMGSLVPTASPFTHANNSSIISDIADYNNDGYTDLLVFDFWANGMRLYKGGQGLNFILAQTLPTGTHGAKGYFEDMDQDGDLDIYNVSSGSAAVIAMHIFTNNGGAFTKATYASDGDKSMTPIIWAKDINHDGRKDVISMIGSPFDVRDIGYWLQNPDKTYTTMALESLDPAEMSFGAMNSLTYGWEDLNSDGFEDFIFLHDTYSPDSARTNAVYTSATPPYFDKPLDLSGAGIPNSIDDYWAVTGQTMVMGDIDRDGAMDVVTCHRVFHESSFSEYRQRKLKVFLDPFNRNGNFEVQTINLDTTDISEAGFGLLLADLDKDNDLELVSLGNDDTLRVFGMKANPTSVKDISGIGRPKFTIYPNPAQNILNIHVAEPDAVAINAAAIYNMEGRAVQRLTAAQLKSDIDISLLASGNYYMTLYNDEGQHYTQKFVKAR